MPRKREMNWAKRAEEIEFEEGRQASAKRREREDKPIQPCSKVYGDLGGRAGK